jgi:hypothetical protein
MHGVKTTFIVDRAVCARLEFELDFPHLAARLTSAEWALALPSQISSSPGRGQLRIALES